MALQFIFGGSGSGKTHYLYQRVLKEAGENPALTYIVLVPEQFTMQTQKDLVLMSEKKGIMNIDVLSFGRLAYRVFEETGLGKTPVLDDEGKNLVLQKLARDHETELRVLKGNIKKLGYISEVKSVLSEFDQYDIGLEEIDRVMESAGDHSYLYYKLHDIRVMYEAFRTYLKKRYVTKEEILDVLAKAVPESSLLKKSVVVLDGFTGFTPVQNRLLIELMKICKEVFITITIDPRENPYIYQGPYELFAMSKHSVTSLVRMAKEQKIDVKDEIWKKEMPYPRFDKSEALSFLEKNLFRYSKQIYKKEVSEIVIHEAANIRAEADVAAATIRRLVRTKGYRYREIGVIITDMNTYGDALWHAFHAYRIPAFMDHKRNIMLNSFVEYLRSTISMVEQQFSFESVFRFLRSGYGPFVQDDIELLENYCRALGIKGYKKWQERWIRREPEMTEEELSHLNHLRVEFVTWMDELVFILRQKKKTVSDITQGLYHFIEKQGLQQKLKEQEESFTVNGEHALAREYAQVYGAVIELFDKFIDLLGDEPVRLNEYAELLDAGLSEARIGVIPPGLDQVIVGDVQRTRLKDIRALFVLGVNDSFLPGALLRTGLLGERDREKFQNLELKLTPGGKEQTYIQKFYLYLNLTRPEEELHLFYSKTDLSGKSIRPAYLLSEIKKLFPKVCVVEEEKLTLAQKELTPQTGVRELIHGLKHVETDDADAWMELYTWYFTRASKQIGEKESEVKSCNPWKRKIEQILDANYWNYQPENLSEEAARQLYGEHFMSSISRMEKFSSCAFAHFLTYGLRLKERSEYEFQALDLGNVFHTAIEKYSKKLKEQRLQWTGVPEDSRKKLVRDCVEEAVTDYGNSVLYASHRSEYMVKRLERLLDRTVWALTDQLKKGDFIPEAYEMTFGSGKIDRIDLCHENDELYVKVMDYKTGRTGFDISAFYHGLQLQLMVYMNAAIDVMKQRYPACTVIPSGVFYYKIDDPFVEKSSDAYEEKLLKELRLDGIVNLKGNSLGHLDRTLKGTSTVVPVRLNKDGSLAKSSKAVSEDAFDTMLSYAKEKSKRVSEQIRQGEISVNPYENGQMTGCDYCRYQHICGFHPEISGFAYRELVKLSQEEAIIKMRQDMGREEH